jgi:hypothetical protein
LVSGPGHRRTGSDGANIRLPPAGRMDAHISAQKWSDPNLNTMYQVQEPNKPIHSSQCCGSGSRRAKMTHRHRKKLTNLIFLSGGWSLLRAEGFSCSLDISKQKFLIKKKIKQFFSCIFTFRFWSSKPWIRIHLKCWIRIRIRIQIQ